MVIGDPVEAEMPPSRILGAVEDPGLARLLKGIRHMSPVPCKLAPYQGISVRPDYVGIRRNVKPCTCTPHMMVILERVGMPFSEKQPGNILGFNKVQGEGVTVVIVPRILVVQIWQHGSLVFGAEVLVVPIGHHDLAVWVEARHHEEDHVIQDLFGCV